MPQIIIIFTLEPVSERRAGEMLKGMEKNKGGGDMKLHQSERTTSETPTLNELQITKDESSQWQRLAAHKKSTPFFVPFKKFKRLYTEKNTGSLIQSNDLVFSLLQRSSALSD